MIDDRSFLEEVLAGELANAPNARLPPQFPSLWDAMQGPSGMPPSLLDMGDGRCLFYAGATHLLVAEPESLKTWIAAAAAAQVMRDGGVVAWVDMDNMGGPELGDRFTRLGVTDDQAKTCCRYIRLDPTDPLDNEKLSALAAGGGGVALVVVDAFDPTIEAYGGSPNAAQDIDRVMRLLVSPFKDKGAAVIIIDHVTKDTDKRGGWAAGSQRKKGAVDVSISVVPVGTTRLSRQSPGIVKLSVLKDRPGHLRQGPSNAIGEMRFTPGVERMGWSFEWDTGKPLAAMQAVSALMQEHDAKDGRAVTCTWMKGHIDAAFELKTIERAVRLLTDDGCLAWEMDPNKGAVYRYRTLIES